MKPAKDVLEDAKGRSKLVRALSEKVVQYFIDREGELFRKDRAVSLIAEEYDISEDMSSEVLSNLIGDLVDPVIQINKGGEKKIGVIEFRKGSFWYGYRHNDDLDGNSKRMVCALCVRQAEKDHEVAFAEEGRGSMDENLSWEELEHVLVEHRSRCHGSESSDEIEIGAKLLSGTTVGGNTVWHLGNDGKGSGLSAEKVDGEKTSIWAVPSQQYLKIEQSILKRLHATGTGVRGVGIDHNTNCIWYLDFYEDLYRMNRSGEQTTVSGLDNPSNLEGLGVNPSNGCIWVSGISDTVLGSEYRLYKYNQSGSFITSFQAPASYSGDVGVQSNGSLWHLGGELLEN